MYRTSSIALFITTLSRRPTPTPTPTPTTRTTTARFRFSSFRTLATTSSPPIEGQALVYDSYGRPDRVLKLQNQKYDTTLSDSQVLVKLISSPIHHHDLEIILGNHGLRPKQFPAVGGTEGVGKVLAVGSKVQSIRPNDLVVPANPSLGTWQTHLVASEQDLTKVPPKMDLNFASTINSFEAAHHLLTSFVQLKSGDIVIHNGANGAVGRAVIQLAKERGFRTISVLNEQNTVPDVWKEKLKKEGAHVVVLTTDLASSEFKSVIFDLPRPRLALNAGLPSNSNIARFLANNGVLVTYGSLTRDPVRVANHHFIHNNITASGFYLPNFYTSARESLIRDLNDLEKSSKLHVSVERFEFRHFVSAIQATFVNEKREKPLLYFP